MSRSSAEGVGRWLERTFRGAGEAREIRPEDVAEVGRDIRVVDVRERDELRGPRREDRAGIHPADRPEPGLVCANPQVPAAEGGNPASESPARRFSSHAAR